MMLSTAGHSNLMDHVFSIMEEYTWTLEQEIGDRTKELTEQKKKADLLLSKMLPSSFDTLIEQHGVYKVESIGDGYLCVSGLPARNGHRHVKEIVEMSISFMDYVEQFKVVPFPKEKIQLRIGVNSGSCVAGVVGLSMPRYCLFGDTVNTASRMESNGKPGKIHISESAFTMLQQHYHGEFNLENRGEIIIKGKGVMKTFWLNGRRSYTNREHKVLQDERNNSFDEDN
ncbi:adenylate/guanylate cyclase catalytic domain protein [Teladorsagia circumcincta]|uniref:Adenylate/guanylate cyclase catalytic domain protein n=1 Tax=Teladorsagia circumcincta TaxID=45464 RepID=A0A2G9TU64_TELCI|nr:adenylate/guanylate cyclase catalytic domain protein [Teladorsagia circumcincta]